MKTASPSKRALSASAALLALGLAAGPTVAAAPFAPGDLFIVDPLGPDAATPSIVRVDRATGGQVVVTAGDNLVFPTAVAWDPLTSTLLVADAEWTDTNGAIVRVNPATDAQAVLSSGSTFVEPSGIAVAPNGDIFVADTAAGPGDTAAIFLVDRATGAPTLFTSGGNLVQPNALAIGPDNAIYVADPNGPDPGNVIRIDPVTKAQTILNTAGSLNEPWSLSFDSAGNLLVADFDDETGDAGAIYRLAIAGGPTAPILVTGDVVDPTAALEIDGSLYVLEADFNNPSVLRFALPPGAPTPLTSGDNLLFPVAMTAAPIPEPASLASLMALGGGALLSRRRRRQHRQG